MDWGTLVKDIAIPAITIVAAYLGARWGRNSAFRERIYDKQIEAYAELLAGADELYDAITQSGKRSLYGPHPYQRRPFNERISEWKRDVFIADHELYLKTRKYRVFIPKEVYNALWDFRGSSCDLANHLISYSPDLADWDKKADIIAPATPAYEHLYAVARCSLGTDMLVKEMNTSFGIRSWSQLWKRNKPLKSRST